MSEFWYFEFYSNPANDRSLYVYMEYSPIGWYFRNGKTITLWGSDYGARRFTLGVL